MVIYGGWFGALVFALRLHFRLVGVAFDWVMVGYCCLICRLCLGV